MIQLNFFQVQNLADSFGSELEIIVKLLILGTFDLQRLLNLLKNFLSWGSVLSVLVEDLASRGDSCLWYSEESSD